MILYTKDNEKIQIHIKKENRIGGELYGNVYKLSDSSCIKIYKSIDDIDLETLKLIKKLDLKNYYKIYEFYYSNRGALKAHTMKYYTSEEIDILTTEMPYTLTNLANLLESVDTLNRNNIVIDDTHSNNAILGSTEITIIDVDLYHFNRFYNKFQLKVKNINALKYLFESLFIEAIIKYHPEYNTFTVLEVIKSIFNLYDTSSVENTYRRLEKYKYPIDYVRKRVK